MTRISRLAVSPLLAVALCATSLPASAQEFSTQHPVASSVIVTSVVSVVVVTAPIWLLSAGVSKASDGSARRSRAARERKAQPLPALTVETVEQSADGAVQVALKNPQAPNDLAVLRWPAQADSPLAGVGVGDVLAFTPTPGGAGWNMANAQGTTLAFLPTDPDAAQPSARW